jgi:hypothetical protein
MIARPSQETHRKKRTILGEGTGNAGVDREIAGDSFAKADPRKWK